FAPDGKALVSGSEGAKGGEMLLWQAVPRGQERDVFTTQGQGVKRVALSPDAKTLVLATVEGALRRWDLTTRQETGPLPVPFGSPRIDKGFPTFPVAAPLLSLRVDPDGKCVVFAQTTEPGEKAPSLVRWDEATGQKSVVTSVAARSSASGVGPAVGNETLA